MMTDFDQEYADRLMDEAIEALEIGEPEAALKIAKTLNRMRYSGGFEMEALAYADLGEKSKAIRVLRTGLEKCPVDWGLWQLLGNYLSDEGEFEEAFEAYENGLSTEGSDTETVNLNYAISLFRSGDAQMAEERIAPILDAPGFSSLGGSLRARLLALELEILRGQGKWDEAVARFGTIGNADFGPDAGQEISILWAEYARSLHELGRHDEAEKSALRSARFDHQNKDALWLLRKMRRKSEDKETNHYNLMVGGTWFPSPDKKSELSKGFFATFAVCADDEDEALRFVAELQTDEIKNLRIEEVELVDQVTEPKGVYSATAYMLYGDEDDEKS